MKCALLVLVIAIPAMAGAQIQGEINQNKLLTDVRGIPIAATTAYNTVGSPFFPADYCNATIKVLKGKKYENIATKVNLQSNEVYVKFDDGIEVVAAVPLEYVDFDGCSDGKKISFRSGFPSIDKQTETTYYQVLSEGDITLLKNFNTTFRDQTLYGASSVTRTFESSPWYYAYTTGAGIMRLKDNAAVLQLLPTQKGQVEKFINDENIKIKREDDLVRLFSFLNTLSSKKN